MHEFRTDIGLVDATHGIPNGSPGSDGEQRRRYRSVLAPRPDRLLRWDPAP
jgi:hypothetical protein